MANVVPWTAERLAALDHKKLSGLYERALGMDSDDARDLVELVQQHKLLSRLGGGYPRDHRIIQALEKVCRSDEGIAAAIDAASSGEAPMAGVDPLLKEALGEDYGHRDTASWAGTFVAEEVEAAGWKRKGRKSLPKTCVAKSAAFFVLPSEVA